MDEAVLRISAEYEARWGEQMVGVREALAKGALPDRTNLLMPIGRETAMLVHALAVGGGITGALDLGTSFGYSALWLADAMRRTGGRVISIDRSAEKQAFAAEQLARAGLADHVEFVTGDVPDAIAPLPGPFDLVLIDIFDDGYIPSIDAVLPKLKPGALVLADNMTFPEPTAESARRYRDHVRSLPGMEAVLIDVGHGLDLARYLPA